MTSTLTSDARDTLVHPCVQKAAIGLSVSEWTELVKSAELNLDFITFNIDVGQLAKCLPRDTGTARSAAGPIGKRVATKLAKCGNVTSQCHTRIQTR